MLLLVGCSSPTQYKVKRVATLQDGIYLTYDSYHLYSDSLVTTAYILNVDNKEIKLPNIGVAVYDNNNINFAIGKWYVTNSGQLEIEYAEPNSSAFGICKVSRANLNDPISYVNFRFDNTPISVVEEKVSAWINKLKGD